MPTVRIYQVRGLVDKGIRGRPNDIIGRSTKGDITVFYDAEKRHTPYELCGISVSTRDLRSAGYEKIPERLCFSEQGNLPLPKENGDWLRIIPTLRVCQFPILYQLLQDLREEMGK